MSIYLGQLPPAELARLKAELAETLIASFCYPRFYDYRTGTLRMRPVDRSRRQEVWLYLSSFDFSAWNRVDLLSPDFQYQIERLFIQFVQRNRSFFGEQGRKRLSDVRMLISTCAASVAEDLRAHLTGQTRNRPPFGSPRPVPSWSTTSATGQKEPNWERIAQSTFLLQQQVQEWRGEIKGVPQLPTPGQSETARQQPATAAPAPRRPARTAGMAKGTGGNQQDHAAAVQLSPEQEAARTGNGNVPSAPAARASGPLYPPTPAKASGPLQPPVQQAAPAPIVAPAVPAVSVPSASRGATANGKSGPLASSPAYPAQTAPESTVASVVPVMPSPAAAPFEAREAQIAASVRPDFPGQVKTADPVLPQAMTASAAQARGVPQPATPASASMAPAQRESTTAALSGEDVAIFEQLRHQLLLWLRIEAVQCGLDISGQSATQLLDLLRQQGSIDETHLQVVSNLLNLASQVMKNGQASLLDYKQAMMFHLMHTRSRR
jgi:hypothetical protein